MGHTECKWRIQTPFFQYQANFRFSFALWYAVLRWCIQTPQWLSDNVVVKLMCDMSLGLCSRQSLQPGEPIKRVVLSAICVSDGWLFHLADIVLWLAKRPFTHVFGGSEKTNMPVVVGLGDSTQHTVCGSSALIHTWAGPFHRTFFAPVTHSFWWLRKVTRPLFVCLPKCLLVYFSVTPNQFAWLVSQYWDFNVLSTAYDLCRK